MNDSFAEWKVRGNPKWLPRQLPRGRRFSEFLVLWALFPVVFFTFSKSKTARLYSAVDPAHHAFSPAII